jgi:amino acid adenylation domain-containing protein
LDPEIRSARLSVSEPSGVCVHETVALRAAEMPDALAVAGPGLRLTYGELDQKAGRLARHLLSLGVGPEVPVAVLAGRSVEAVVAILAVLKAGGCYLPLDPAWPEERLSFILADSGASVLLTQGPAPAVDSVRVRLEEEVPEAEGAPELPRVSPDHLAYVIYTSGSTGRPKGVEVEHRGLSNLAAWLLRVYGITPAVRATRFAGPAFDASVLEVWPYLMAGASLHVPEGGVILSPERIVEWLVRERITHAFLPTPLAEAMLAEPWPADAALEALLTGGDRLHRRPRADHPFGLFNHYGPTENSVVTTWGRVEAEGEGMPSIGRPIDGVEVVLDEAGEVLIGGVGLARGYRSRPDLTAERFVPAPEGKRLYRSGDLARVLPSGELDFIGRADFQVKIRGVRIELGEIEAVLRRHPAVREGVVLAREDELGGRSLAGYVVADGEVAPADLRAWLARELPDVMVPAAWVFLEALPLTPNGKVDRAALPAPERVEDDYVAPRTATEERLAGIFADLLGVDRVGATDDFFLLGGHSLLASRVLSRVREAFGVELEPRSIFERPTVAGLAGEIAWGSADDAAPLVREPRGGALPLSFAQERLWFLDRLAPGSALYNLPLVLHLSGPLRVQALATALDSVVSRHEALRTVFAEVDGAPVQTVEPFVPRGLSVVDVTGLPGEASWIAAEEAVRPFDLRSGPLLRALLLRLGPQEHRLLLNQHHVVSDAWSMDVLLRDLAALYAGEPLPELPVQYPDFAVWQKRRLTPEALAGRLAPWRERLAGAPAALDLPADRPRPAVQTFRGEVERRSLVPIEALERLGRRNGATPFMVYLAAFLVLLKRLTGEADLVVGTPAANRERPEVQGLIGFFVNTLALRVGLSGDPAFPRLLSRVREASLAAWAEQEVPFEKIVEALAPERDLSRSPVFQVALGYLGNPFDLQELAPGLALAVEELGTGTAKFDLTLHLRVKDGALEATAEYATDLFDAATVRRFLGHFQTLLEGIAAHPEARVSELPLLSEAERAELLSWGQNPLPVPQDVCLHTLFESWVDRAPDDVAVEWVGAGEGERLTYRELDEAANRLAWHLIAQGVGPEVWVGLSLPRSVAMIVGLLAVLKAGGAYVPLDPSYPAERLAYIAGETRPRVVLTRESLLAEAEAIAARPASRPAVPPSADNAAYVIFTSGSTGRPKGVVVPHVGLPNLAEGTVPVFRVGPGDRTLLFAPLAFDTSLFEIVMALRAGATLCIASQDDLLPGPGLLRRLREKRITRLTLTPSALAALPEEELPGVVSVAVAGEACPAELVERWGKTRPFFNCYGPTESTVWSSVALCRDGSRKPTIGRPVANKRIYVVDPELNPVPAGVLGELWVGGIGAARGYLNRPDLTAERFWPDPFAVAPGARAYRTGDLVRWVADGEIDFVGRNDFQVKIRGFRIELGEIEAALAAHEAVREAVVLARGEGSHRQLVGYVVARNPVSAADLRAHLADRLPDYMVPAGWVFLEALPLTPNDKVDRQALLRMTPEAASRDGAGPVAPRTPVEQAVAEIFAGLLGAERVGALDDFFALGGHSLLATQALSRVRRTFGVELPVRALFEEPTVTGLARRIERELRQGDGPEAPPLVPAPRTGPLPLSFAQERLWFLDRLEPGTAVYNLPAELRLTGPLRIDRIAAALDALFRRHEALRTVFALADGEPVQDILPFAPAVLPVVDLAALPGSVRETEAERLSLAEGLRPFNLETGPLLRTALLRLGEEDNRLVLAAHHIVSDGWSMDVLLRDLAGLYGGAALPELPVQYPDFAVWQRRWLAGPVLDGQLAFWRERLGEGSPALDLPADRPRPPVQTYRGALTTVPFAPGLAGRVAGLARREGGTAFMALLAAFDALLLRYTGEADLRVGTPIANRNRAEIEGLIGFFVNTLVLRVDTGGDPAFGDLLGRVKESALSAWAHQDLPFERLVQALAPERDLSRSPLFQVLFLHQAGSRAGSELAPGIGMALWEIPVPVAKFDLTVSLAEEGGQLAATAEYSTDLFDEATVRRLLGHLGALVSGIVEDPGARLSALPLLTAGEVRQLVAWNEETRHGWPVDGLLHGLFLAQVERTPDATALIAGDERLSYAELRARSGALARQLAALGVGPEVPVGICLDRTAHLVVAMLATLEAGGFYVPLDPAYPAERLAFMLEDSGCAVILTQTHLVDRLPVHSAAVLTLDAPAGPSSTPPTPPAARNLAYLIYTSGSTGRPKGVAIEHRSAVVFAQWAREEFSPEELAGVLASTSITFDLSVFEIFVPLAWGGTVILAENALALPSLPARDEVRTINTVPSAIAELLRTDGLPASVATVNLAGEGLSRPLSDRVYAKPSVERLYNLYGPSEDTTYSTWTLVERSSARPPSIGRPLDDTRAWIVDSGFRLQPVGVPGELLLGGAGLARGYFGRPELTAERFVPDPFGDEPGARLYRTGDLARVRPDGTIDYLGRLDHQVKVRGFRIELGEVESALGRLPEVEAAVVLAREDAGGDKVLVGYVVPRPGAPGDLPAALRTALGRSLPPHMVPTAWVVLPALPLTPNGKVDRKALPAPEQVRFADEAPAAPRGLAEELLAGIFAQVLGVDRVGARDDFFTLGGHSLLTARLVARVRGAFGVDLSVRSVFEHPTVERLARWIASAERGPLGPPLAPRPRDGALPLSFAQERLWVLDRLDPGSAVYNMPMAFRLRGPLDGQALAAALSALAARHETLRTVFSVVDGAPVQVIRPPAPVALPVVDVSPEEAARLVREEAVRPFDLGAGPLFRALLLRLDETEHLLLLSTHHIVSDGWSLEVMVRELAALFDSVSLPPLPVQYADFAAWQREWLAGEALEGQLAYWRKRLAGAPSVLELPVDRPYPKAPTFRGAIERGDALVRAEDLEGIARREGSTLFMVLLAAFEAVLHRWTGQADLLVGTPVAGRTRVETEGLIGFFVNTLVLRGDLSDDPAFTAHLGRVRETALSAWAHQDLPFERLVEDLAPGRDLSRMPLVQVMFDLQRPPAPLVLSGISAPLEEIPTGTAKLDLLLAIEEREEGLAAAAEYAADLFDAATVRRLLGHLGVLLWGIVERPEARVSELPLLSAAERDQLLVEWNRTVTSYPREATIHGLFAEQARRTPEAVALSRGAERLTYAELDARAERLAGWLRALGVGPEVAVGLCLERSFELIAAILGILKAGGFYVPLDPSYPAERLAAMLEDVEAPVLVTQERLAGTLPDTGAVVVILESLGEIRGVPPGNAPDADNLAYVMFTSGSTGRPKGVAVTHRNVVRLVRETGYARFGPEEVFLQLAPAAFDASTLEIWGALLNGGRLAVFPPGTPSLAELGRGIAEEGVTTLWLTAGLFHPMVEEEVESLRAVRQLLAGGDVLSPAHVRRALEALPGTTLVNGYGPTENTTFTCCHPMTDPAEVGATVPIGRPIANTRVWLLDRGLAPVPVGVAGELYAGGDGLARGYAGRPDLTAARFVPDPVSGEPGARLYATGDLARFRADGVIEFLGRADLQVKVRGFRIELGEIEAALSAHPAVQGAVVLLREEAGDKRLAAFVTLAAPGAADAETLRAFLGERLPAYMLPGAVVEVDAFPLTPNGKVDRRALAALALPAPETGAGEAEAPSTPVEAALAGAFAELLGVSRVGRGDDFFHLGGHSLLATRLASRVRELFGVEIPLRAIFEAPTVRDLAARVEQARREDAGTAGPPILPREGGERIPLSYPQQRLWLLDRLDPGTAVYNVPALFRITGAMAPGVLAAALTEIVRRHEALRTTFEAAGEGPAQAVAPPAPHPLPVVDVAALAKTARAAESARLAREEAVRPFDLDRGPLLRTTLVRLGPEDHTLLLTMHHIVSDGWSMGLLLAEISALYEAGSAGRPSPLPELPVQYPDFALWQRRWLDRDGLEARLAWWRQRLAGRPEALDLPADRPRPAVLGTRGAVERLELPDDLAGELKALSWRRGTTLYMTLLAAVDVLLARSTGQRDLLVGSPVANRGWAEVERLIGFFVNTLVMRADASGDPSFLDLLARVRETALGAWAHQDLPFETLVQDLAPERDLSRSPLFQVSFALQNAPAASPTLGPGILLAEEPIETGTAKFDLGLAFEEVPDGLVGGAEYSTGLFDPATIRRILGHFRALLEGIVAAPEARISDLPLLTEAEREQLLVWNRTASLYPRETTIHALFREQARRTPEAVAVISGEERLTYAELAAQASRLARRFRAEGVGPDVPVVLLLERSAGMVAASLAVLEAGGAYVPLDPGDPAERLRFVLEDTGAPVVVARGALPAGVETQGARLLLLDSPDGPELPVADDAGAANLAYVIYTSGSTGRPKGVAVTHRSVGRLVLGTDYLQIVPRDRVAHLSNPAFDAAVFELWGALLNGAAVVVIPRETALSPERLAAEIEARGVTAMFLTTALFNLLVREAPRALSAPRAVLFGGEAVDPGAVRACIEAGPPERLLHVYGPTESTTFTTWHRVKEVAEGETVLIGLPIANTTVHVLDLARRPVAVGVPGELLIGGDGLARGYFRRPGLTAERFVPDPFAEEPGGRLYRTGDLARRRLSGAIEFLGRIDHQVKVRGFRIELGEIETALAAHPGVAGAVVLAREDVPGERRLVAYVVPGEGEAPDVRELRAFLADRLPAYMVPGAFVILGSFPLTPNGKIDRRALPAPERTGKEAARVAPRTPAEERLAEAWSTLLGVDPVGAHDDFFELGGHSLLATRLVSRVRDLFGIELPLKAVFESPTLSALAARIETARLAGQGLDAPPILSGGDGRVLPLSFAQQRLWFLDRLEPDSAVYNIPLILRLHGPLAVPALATALTEIVRRHEVLRTTYGMVSGEPVQAVHPPAPLPFPVVDLAALPEPAREAESDRLSWEEARRPFDLLRGPVFRASLVRLSGEDHRLLPTLHHIAGDGWSMGVLLAELADLYAAALAGRPSPIPELSLQYADFALWQRRWLEGGALEAQLAFWRGALSGSPLALNLPADHPRPTVRSGRGAGVGALLPAELATRLGSLSRERGATLFMTLLAGFDALLYRLTGEPDLLVGTPVANRNRAETEPLIGFFVNTLALRADLADDPAFEELLARTRETALAAYAHQDLPFERLVEELSPERDLSRTPIVQVSFTLQASLTDRAGLAPGLSFAAEPVEMGTAKFDLALGFAELADGLLTGAEYASDLFDAATVERMLGHLATLLSGASESPGARISSLPLLSAAERDEIAAANAGLPRGTFQPEEATVRALFEAQAEHAPEAPALVTEEGIVSYAGLRSRALRIAARLQALGVGPEVPVGVYCDRTAGLVTAFVAVIEAGGVYVPLDPSLPAERIALLLADAGCAVVLAESALPAGIAIPGPVLRIGEAAEGEAGPFVPPALEPGNLAYVIYTSGSTGTPKRVGVAHGPAAAHAVEAGRFYGLGPGDRFLLFHAPGFDVAVENLMSPLLSGAALVPRGPELPSPAEITRRIGEQGITVVNFAPAYWIEWARTFEGAVAAPPTLRLVIVGGDEMPGPIVRLVAGTPLRHVRLLNVYGPTETVVTPSMLEVWDLAGPVSGTVPLGPVIPGRSAYVLDWHGNPLPQGVPGELYIGGLLARGYLGQPALTAERFVPDPFSGRPGARLYRTGDLARSRPDGTFDFAGRADYQVKIRGFRVEPGEVEATLLSHPRVAAAAVVVTAHGGEKRLVAYAVPREGEALETRELRAFLAESLPPYMVPAAFMVLPAFPLSPNGKVDRRALPAPEAEDAPNGRMAPRTPTEELLADVWAALLGLGSVGVHDNFFRLGGHSLLATRLVSRIREIFGVELPLRAVFESSTVESLAARVAAEQLAGAGLHVPPILPRHRDEALPLSFAQQRLWFLERLQPGTATYNLPSVFRLDGPLSIPALAAALGEIDRRHDVLRTTFAVVAGEPVQVIAPPAPRPFPVVDLAGLPAGPRNAESARLAQEEARRPFDLSRGPLLRETLVCLGSEEHRLLLTFHHVASDGWSLGVLLDELGALYRAGLAGRPSPLPELPVQYADFALWQRRWLDGDVLAAQLAYWRHALSGAELTLDLPIDRPRPPVRGSRGASEEKRLPAELGARVESLGRSRGATLFMTHLAAFGALMHRYTGAADVLVGTPVAGRTRAETEPLIGFFVNNLVMRTAFASAPTFDELLAETRETALAAYAHQDLPFERLVEQLSPERDLSRTPIVQVSFAVDKPLAGGGELAPGLTLASEEVDLGISKLDLSWGLVPGPDGLLSGAEYATDLFDAATIQRMISHLEVLLAGIVADPGARVSELPLLTQAEQAQLAAWNDGLRRGLLQPEEATVRGLFDAQVRRTPDAPAVVSLDGTLTYAGLHGRALRIAARLTALGVGPEVPVGVFCDRTAGLAIGLIAVLEAGGVYVPIDPTLPADRIAFLLADAGCPVVLAEGALPEGVAEGVRVLPLDGDFGEEGEDFVRPVLDPANLAYIIYTSGSTGTPKGVGVSHGAAAAHAVIAGRAYGLGPGERLLFFAAPGFDVSVEDLLCPLVTGAAIVPRGAALPEPAEMTRRITAQGMTVVNFPPAYWAEWVRSLEGAAAVPAPLRLMVVGGDEMPAEIVRLVHRTPLKDIQLLNGYGPTEAVITATLEDVGEIPENATGPVPIGQPLPGRSAWILDRDGSPLPVGVPGELALGGLLARGYLRQPALTAGKFVPDPFSGLPGARLYLTGDLARRRPDGRIDFLGRVDHQVKIRGFRIEPGEIEAALLRHPQIAATVVMARTVGKEKLLAAYVVPSGGEAPEIPDLRAFLGERLPAHMVPAAFVVLDAFPLTPSGKVDRRALPAPDRNRTADSFVAPRTPLETEVAGIWGDVLGIEKVGLQDGFFDLGGHSLLATRVLARIEEAFGVDIPLQTLFESPTLEGFTAALGKKAVESMEGMEGLSDEELALLLQEEG